MTELCIVHSGPLAPSVWGRLGVHVPLRVLDLEAITPYWEAGRTGEPGELTVASLVRRLRGELDAGPRVLLGWGFGGLVAHALAGPADHVVALDTTAPAAEPAELPDEALLPGFAAYLAVRRGRTPDVVPAPPVDAALAALAGEADTAPAALRRLYVAYARGRRRDRALAAAHTPPAHPLTLVRAARGIGAPAARPALALAGSRAVSTAPSRPVSAASPRAASAASPRRPSPTALGWEGHPGLEVLVSAGDHYSMLTEPAAVAHLAALLCRWLAPLPLAA